MGRVRDRHRPVEGRRDFHATGGRLCRTHRSGILIAAFAFAWSSEVRPPVESLAHVPIPEALAAGGSTPCSASCAGSKSYTYCGANTPVGPGCNSLLDVLVGGCKVLAPVCAAPINAQQRDVMGSDNDLDPLTLGTGNKVPDSQVLGNDDGYSVYMKFTANRAHVTGVSCTGTGDCQTGLTCVGGVCR